MNSYTIENQESESFSDEEFWPIFESDLTRARGHVIIQSAFLAIGRLKQLVEPLQALNARGITVCIFLQDPNYFDRPQKNTNTAHSFIKAEEFDYGIRLLRKLGCHVNLRSKIHQKFGVVDNEILWDGSLNILSYNDTREHMRRFASRAEADEIVAKYGLKDCAECIFNRSQCAIIKEESELISIGKIISQHRRDMNLSQRKLASICGIAPARIRQLEAGESLTLNSLMNITDKLRLETLVLPSIFVPSVVKLLRQLSEARAISAN